MPQLVFLRHGQSVWNQENRFTGWADVDLSAEGLHQATQAGQVLRQHGYKFDIGFTSVLTRAIKTLHVVLEEMNLLWIPVEKSWRLNERFYGALQGLDKAQVIRQSGEEQVRKWRRDPHQHPPALRRDDPRFPGHDARYWALTAQQLPLTENLTETMARVLPWWAGPLTEAIRNGQKVLVCAHGNSLRALAQHIGQLTDEEVAQLDIPTGVPLVYELDEAFNSIRHHYLSP